MLVDIRVILSGPMALIVAGTLTMVAIFSKWLAAFFTRLIFKYSKAQGQLIFGLSSAHAAATLAIILVGYQAGILDENILNGTIILILITCIVASFATEKAAKTIIVESESDVSELVKSAEIQNEHILFPIVSATNIEKVLEFLILIKDKKSVHPISVLSVVSNDAEAEINILKSKNKLEEYVRQASAFEAKVNIITTIDHNPSSGISRIAREIMADIIMLGWPRQYGFVDKIFGKKLDNLLRSSDKTIFVGHLEKPLALLKRIVIIVPPLAEFENGFTLWVMKMAKLAQELSIPMVVYSNETSKIAVEKVFSKEKLSAKLYTYLFIDWDDFLVLSKYIQEEDLLVLVSARKGTTSYMRILETIPLKFEKYFAINSRLVIYPQEYDTAIIERFEDISGEPLDRGIEAVQKIGKGIGSIFKGNDQS